MRVLDVIKQFKNKGYKVTPQRRAIINALLFGRTPYGNGSVGKSAGLTSWGKPGYSLPQFKPSRGNGLSNSN